MNVANTNGPDDGTDEPAARTPPAEEPVLIPLVSTQPIPLSARSICAGGIEYTSRVWKEGDADRCRLCPRGKCGISRVPGVCDHCLARDADAVTQPGEGEPDRSRTPPDADAGRATCDADACGRRGRRAGAGFPCSG